MLDGIGPRAYQGVPCWRSRTSWLIAATTAYHLRYLRLERELRATHGGGGITMPTFLAIARALSEAADGTTGRNACTSNAIIATATGYTAKTVQRAKWLIRRLGLGTIVFTGRRLTLAERLAKWARGSTQRGLASIWALHEPPPPAPQCNPPYRPPETPGTQAMSPLPEGVEKPSNSHPGTSSPTGKPVAARNPPGPRSHQRDALAAGLALGRRWRSDPGSPVWARQHSPRAWARLLDSPARHGWTVDDLNAAIGDWARSGHHLPASPHKPIGLLGAILAATPLAPTPTQARHAATAEARDRRAAIDACPRCDHNGMAETPHGAMLRCTHSPDQPLPRGPQREEQRSTPAHREAMRAQLAEQLARKGANQSSPTRHCTYK
ncbi:Replication protein Rep [Lolliginicoccus levis]|uniref:Replication protein Rep n=1 Tax=Lolliginicoccus levis TaxID=2919542 RepID=UPI00241F478F|nr:Replication protein Rep [Lolliginicoccus levis]